MDFLELIFLKLFLYFLKPHSSKKVFYAGVYHVKLHTAG